MTCGFASFPSLRTNKPLPLVPIFDVSHSVLFSPNDLRAAMRRILKMKRTGVSCRGKYPWWLTDVLLIYSGSPEGGRISVSTCELCRIWPESRLQGERWPRGVSTARGGNSDVMKREGRFIPSHPIPSLVRLAMLPLPVSNILQGCVRGWMDGWEGESGIE